MPIRRIDTDHPYGFLEKVLDGLNITVEDVKIIVRESNFMVLRVRCCYLPAHVSAHVTFHSCLASQRFSDKLRFPGPFGDTLAIYVPQ